MAFRYKYAGSRSQRAAYNKRRAAAKKGWATRGRHSSSYRHSRRSRRRKSGCYIATCVYGSYDCPQVWTLRRYRDQRLARTLWGRLFIRMYYALSPVAVRIFGKTKLFRKFWKTRLDHMIQRLNASGISDNQYIDCSGDV